MIITCLHHQVRLSTAPAAAQECSGRCVAYSSTVASIQLSKTPTVGAYMQLVFTTHAFSEHGIPLILQSLQWQHCIICRKTYSMQALLLADCCLLNLLRMQTGPVLDLGSRPDSYSAELPYLTDQDSARTPTWLRGISTFPRALRSAQNAAPCNATTGIWTTGIWRGFTTTAGPDA